MAAWIQLASVETPDSSACVVLGTTHERYAKANDGTPALCSSLQVAHWQCWLMMATLYISTDQGYFLCLCLGL